MVGEEAQCPRARGRAEACAPILDVLEQAQLVGRRLRRRLVGGQLFQRLRVLPDVGAGLRAQALASRAARCAQPRRGLRGAKPATARAEPS